MRIPGALKLYDCSMHERDDLFKFILNRRIILLLQREDVFSGRGVEALKSCDAYSRSTQIVRFFCAWAGRFSKIYPSSSKKSFTPTRGCVFRPRSWSNKIMRRVFSEHRNRTIFLCMSRAIFSNLFLIFEKFFYSDERIYFLAAELKH